MATNQGHVLTFLDICRCSWTTTSGGNSISWSKNARTKRSAAVDAFRERYLKELARRPLVSDEEFLAETEVTDEQYAIGFTILIVDEVKEVKDDRE